MDFHLGGGLNPLRWLGPGDADKALRPMAHFLCLDRWGPPTAAELRNRMPFHVGVRRHGFIRCTSYPDHQAHSWQKISLDSLTANRAAFHFCRMAAPTRRSTLIPACEGYLRLRSKPLPPTCFING